MKIRLLWPAGGRRDWLDVFEAIAYEAREYGYDAEVVAQAHGSVIDSPETVYVVSPAEYFAETDPDRWLSEAQLERCIGLVSAHPLSQEFEVDAQQARRCARVYGFAHDTTGELLHRSLPARRFQVGYTAYWDRRRPDRLRGTDLVYRGASEARRNEVLAGAAKDWWDLRVRLDIAPDRPDRLDVGPTRTAPVELYADSEVVVHLQRYPGSSLEWLPMVQAICNGAVVLSETIREYQPLQAGAHFLMVSTEDIAAVARALVRDPETRATIRSAADEALKQIPLSRSVSDLIEQAWGLLREPRPVAGMDEVETPPKWREPGPGWPSSVEPEDVTRLALRRLESTTLSLRRQMARLTRRLESAEGKSGPELASTPSWEGCTPVVSVIVTVYNYAHFVAEALSSLLACAGVEFEVLVQDDASADHSWEVILDFVGAHPELPLHAYRSPFNQGLSASRDELLERSRGRYVFNLDADNGVYPSALALLAEALDADPEAAFAYAPIARLRAGRPIGLTSIGGWEPELLRQGNYIDAMAMTRRDVVSVIGAWDRRMQFGWEDFQLWARLAEAGHHAVYVPQVLSWYRVGDGSMLSGSDLEHLSLWTAVREAAPILMGDRRHG